MAPLVSIEQRTSARCNSSRLKREIAPASACLNRAAHFRALQRHPGPCVAHGSHAGLNRAAHFRALQHILDDAVRVTAAMSLNRAAHFRALQRQETSLQEAVNLGLSQ